MQIIDRKFLNVKTNSCHASTIVFYKNYPVFAWFGGSIEGQPDSSIYVQYKDKIHKIGDNQVARWNPVLFAYDDKLFLFIKSGIYCDRWQSFIYSISDIDKDDFDINKAYIQMLPAGLNACVKTKPLVNGKLIHMGSSVETIYNWTSYDEIYTFDGVNFIYHGRSNPLMADRVQYKDAYGYNRYSLGIIQPSLWQDKNDTIHAFFRASRGLGCIYYSRFLDNIDDTNAWIKPEKINIPNPNSSIDVVYHNNELYLVCNPDTQFRCPLVLYKLDDNFNIIDQIIISDENTEEGATEESKLKYTFSIKPEFSYPFMISYNEQLHLTYTYKRKKIEYCIIEP
jgi:predicted neuraminidase